MDYKAEQKMIDDAVAEFPEIFKLRMYPKDRFQISKSASYVLDGKVILYVYVIRDGQFRAFAKGTPKELRVELLELKEGEV